MSRAKAILNEGSDTTFTTSFDDVTIDLNDDLKDLFKDIISKEGFEFNEVLAYSQSFSQTKVKWGYDIEAKESGIKSFSVFCPTQDLTIPVTLSYYLNGGDEIFEEVKDWKVTVDLEVEFSGTLENHFSLYPTELDLVDNKLIF